MRNSKNGKNRLKVRRSGVHGRGVYVTKPVRKGARLIEYTGERISWKEGLARPHHDRANPYHTFYFSLEDGDVIDATKDGNEARWINHSCDPNCEANEVRGRVFVYALKSLKPGEELFYDYQLEAADRRTKKLERAYGCRCGSAKCRGTMLEPRPVGRGR